MQREDGMHQILYLPRTVAIYSHSIFTPDKNNRGVLHRRQGQDRDPHLALGRIERQNDRTGILFCPWVRIERQTDRTGIIFWIWVRIRRQQKGRGSSSGYE